MHGTVRMRWPSSLRCAREGAACTATDRGVGQFGTISGHVLGELFRIQATHRVHTCWSLCVHGTVAYDGNRACNAHVTALRALLLTVVEASLGRFLVK